MSLQTMLTQPATITRRSNTGALDSRNKPTVQTSSVSAQTFIEQLRADEDTYLRDTGRRSVRSYWLPTVVIDVTDKVSVAGVDYEVTGPPQPAMNARLGTVHHLEVYLTAVE